MAYKFKMTNILNYKEQLEREKKDAFGEISALYNKELEILHAFEKEKVSAIQNQNLAKRGNDIGEIQAYQKYIKSLTDKILTQTQLLQKIAVELDHAKQEMLIAMQEKKVMEKLKEKDYENYLNDEKRLEEKMFDGIVTFQNHQDGLNSLETK